MRHRRPRPATDVVPPGPPNCSNRADTCNHRPSAVASANAQCNLTTSTTAVYVHTSLRPVDGWALVLTSSGSTITKPSSTARGSSWSTGNAGSHPGTPVAIHSAKVCSHSAWASSESSNGRSSSTSPGTALGSTTAGPSKANWASDASKTSRARSRCATISCSPSRCTMSMTGSARRLSSPAYWQTSGTLSRGSIADLITDRVPEILGDGQLVGCVPDGRRWYFDRAVLVVADPRPLNGDFAEDGFEGERSCPPVVDASTGFALPCWRTSS